MNVIVVAKLKKQDLFFWSKFQVGTIYKNQGKLNKALEIFKDLKEEKGQKIFNKLAEENYREISNTLDYSNYVED